MLYNEGKIMTTEVIYSATCPRFKLPLLYAGQSQKEIFVNEATSIIDALLHCAIEDELTSPPTAPNNGANWLISKGATGEWQNMDGKLACRQSGNWIYVTPVDGMTLFNRSSGQRMVYLSGWNKPKTLDPIPPTTAMDPTIKSSLNSIIEALKYFGIA
jgi:hypothetical protein